jgi:DNA-binding CsgD family transcriptional regulator
MTTPVSVSENDLHTLLRIVGAPDLGDDGDGLPWSTMDGLKRLIPCETVAFNGIDLVERRHHFEQDTTFDRPETPEEEAPFWEHYWDSHCSYRERTGDLRSVMKVTDFYTLHEFRQTPIYLEYFRHCGQENEMVLCIPAGTHRQLKLLFFRGRLDCDFTERDRALLVLLRPHIHAAHLKVLRRRRGIPELTKRQWELLQLVDAGLGNTQIARRLNISEHTVRKHLENVFDRLQVSSRTEALARVFPGRALV